MFHTFKGSPGSSCGNLLRVRLATGNSTSPPTATSSLYHKPTERTKGENTNQHWCTQEDPNPRQQYQEHNQQGTVFKYPLIPRREIKKLKYPPARKALPCGLAAAAALAAAVRSTSRPCSRSPPQHNALQQPLQKLHTKSRNVHYI
jgi:hypothetical protein